MQNIALIHDHLAQLGGAEKTLQSLSVLFPQAPVYTLLYKEQYAKDLFDGNHIEASFLQNMPWGIKKYQWYMPLMTSAIESFNLSSYDLVISSASSFAKGVITSPQAVHICYCHTPTRYLWHYNNQYLDELRLSSIFKKIINLHLSKLRQWDFNAAQRVDHFIANSQTTHDRIKKYYLRDSTIIHPPVATDTFYISSPVHNYFLTGGRLTPYKRFDLAIEAFNKLGIPLKIFGDGSDKRRLQKMSLDNIEFLGNISEQEKRKYLSHCKAFIHPQEEDFGITQVEAQASGRPVIAYNKGGASEVIIDQQTGILFNEQTWECLADAVLRFEHTDEFSFNPEELKRHAENFSEHKFKEQMSSFINNLTH